MNDAKKYAATVSAISFVSGRPVDRIATIEHCSDATTSGPYNSGDTSPASPLARASWIAL